LEMDGIFSVLNNKVKELAVSRFEKPTLVQELAIPKVMDGKNVLIIAETGGGKTESTLLPIFSKLTSTEHKPVALLYLTPLKSLNRDLLERIIWWCNKLDLDVSVRHGDTTQYERKIQLEHPPHILISTIEQIGAMIVGKRFREHLRNIKYIVVDEVHEIVNSKRGVQLTLSLERLKRLCGNPQIVCLSATVGNPDLAAKFIFSESDFEIINAVSARNIDLKIESPYPSNEDEILAEKIFIGSSVVARLRRIRDLILEHRSTLTFTNTREAAEILSSRLRLLDKNFPHEIHHSSLSKDVRIKAEKDFKEEKLKCLIATSSLQLGIDIGSVDLVIQYQSPRTVTQFIQRLGRSGHGIGRVSKAIIITTEGDDVFESTVIARKALRGEMEPLRVHKKSLDVLTQQLIGLLMEDYSIDPKVAYGIIKKAFPFKDLKEEEFISLVKFLDTQLGLVFFGKAITRRRKAFDYYFGNLSVIPDQKNYKVIDTTTNNFVGTLDEEFIATHGDVGSSFIVKGRPWKILSVEDGKVLVEGVDDIESAVPAWDGELIPVPFVVSQEVGTLRREIKNLLEKDLGSSEIFEELKKKYPVSSQAVTRMVQLIKKQIGKYPLPDERHILVESFQGYTVLHAMFGSLVNETLSRYISAMLSAEHGKIVTSKCDPYRIIFKGCNLEDIKNILFEAKPQDIEIILEKSLPKSSLFRLRFIHAAKRFGAISKTATLGKINMNRLIDAYWNTPIYKETLQEIFTEKVDIARTMEVIDKIKRKEIKISSVEGLSPLAELGFRYELQDVARPESPEKEIFKIFKNRLLNSKVRLLCVNCGKYSIVETVNDIKDVRCRICQSKLIAALKPQREEAQRIVKKWLKGSDLTEEERQNLDFIRKSADLVIDYGRDAAIVLAGRGIGPQTAVRVLTKPRKDEDDLFKHILTAERDFIKNKKYWQ
ncbi:MAG: DEAD/DEAH box helicase, partial [Candidatus Aenigmatarchaeota archaeon]